MPFGGEIPAQVVCVKNTLLLAGMSVFWYKAQLFSARAVYGHHKLMMYAHGW